MNRIRLFLSQARERKRLPLRDEGTLKNAVKILNGQRRRKRLIEIIRSYNKGSTKLSNEEILDVKLYNVYPNYQEEYVNVVNTYQIGGYE